MASPFLKMVRIAATTMLISPAASPPRAAIRCALILLRVRPSVSMCIRAKRSFASWRAHLKVGGKPPVTLKAGEVFFGPAGPVHSAGNVDISNAAELATYVVKKRKAAADTHEMKV
jgi:hypothetical protein